MGGHTSPVVVCGHKALVDVVAVVLVIISNYSHSSTGVHTTLKRERSPLSHCLIGNSAVYIYE